MKILDALSKSQREKGSKIGLLTTAATTGVTVAKFLGKRSIYGIIGGIAVSLAADYIMKKYEKKLETENDDKAVAVKEK
ncbi:hypothetical protein SAMN05421738_101273 [Algoriella xinjiangensis]|uniref:Uncharacterized protein n=1 Tax=Algoriella xinjiangensis TaxID=684065 RepID=A0A1I4SMK5_9FLAO|nr:hypothetical protein [Algoriella xinjiangensis]SFM65645.1 hypothetical protein SAMN05421738_101273 [Algoriella xinjiangensis]VDH16196.1 Uncharacterised protein [Algoriella xinjiangensis]